MEDGPDEGVSGIDAYPGDIPGVCDVVKPIAPWLEATEDADVFVAGAEEILGELGANFHGFGTGAFELLVGSAHHDLLGDISGKVVGSQIFPGEWLLWGLVGLNIGDGLVKSL